MGTTKMTKEDAVSVQQHEKEWNEIVKPYAEGLSGLPYEDFK